MNGYAKQKNISDLGMSNDCTWLEHITNAYIRGPEAMPWRRAELT